MNGEQISILIAAFALAVAVVSLWVSSSSANLQKKEHEESQVVSCSFETFETTRSCLVDNQGKAILLTMDFPIPPNQEVKDVRTIGEVDYVPARRYKVEGDVLYVDFDVISEGIDLQVIDGRQYVPIGTAGGREFRVAMPMIEGQYLYSKFSLQVWGHFVVGRLHVGSLGAELITLRYATAVDGSFR